MNKPDSHSIDQNAKLERIAILGASRGLGKALASNLIMSEKHLLWLSSRKISNSENADFFPSLANRVTLFSADYTKTEDASATLEQLKLFKPTRIVYCAGGGPFGPFEDRPWHAHVWALHLNLLFPARLLHYLIAHHFTEHNDLRQIVFVGSAIAEAKPDPGAASYAAAKHGLKGLISSIIREKRESELDIRLYSPGYMDTNMLPPNSLPRQDGSLIADPAKIADDLWEWIQSSPSRTHWHRIMGIDSV